MGMAATTTTTNNNNYLFLFEGGVGHEYDNGEFYSCIG
jgi:hypothetical protein